MKELKVIGSIVAAGALGYAIYKIMQMSAEERHDLVNKGKNFFVDNLGRLVGHSDGRSYMSHPAMGDENSYS
jgi:hypothetical protein